MDSNMAIIKGRVVKPAKNFTAENYYTYCQVFHLKVGKDVIAVYMADRDFCLLPENVLSALQGKTTVAGQPLYDKWKIKVYGSVESDNTSGRMRLVARHVEFDSGNGAGDEVEDGDNKLRVEGCLCEYEVSEGNAYVVVGILHNRSMTRLSGCISGIGGDPPKMDCGSQYLMMGRLKPVDQMYVYPLFDWQENRGRGEGG